MSALVRWICIAGVFAVSYGCSAMGKPQSEDPAELNRAAAWALGWIIAIIATNVLLVIEINRLAGR